MSSLYIYSEKVRYAHTVDIALEIFSLQEFFCHKFNGYTSKQFLSWRSPFNYYSHVLCFSTSDKFYASHLELFQLFLLSFASIISKETLFYLAFSLHVETQGEPQDSQRANCHKKGKKWVQLLKGIRMAYEWQKCKRRVLEYPKVKKRLGKVA